MRFGFGIWFYLLVVITSANPGCEFVVDTCEFSVGLLVDISGLGFSFLGIALTQNFGF